MKRILIALAICLSLISSLTPSFAFACSSTGNASKDQIISGTGAQGTECNGNGVSDIVNEAVRILSFVAGAAAIIMVIVSGFRYITSGGDTNRVASAKNTLIYAVIGVAIAVLAQV